MKLYEFWFQQLFHEDKVSLLIGLHDLNSEFYVTETSSLFFNSSFGVGKELSQTGANGPSIFPTTAPALRLRAETVKSFHLQFAVFNAIAGDPRNPNGTHLRLNSKDGQLLIAEASYLHNGKYTIGTWAYTATFDHLTLSNDGGNTPVQATNHGVYILVDQTLTENLSGFFRGGLASTEVNRFGSNVSGGLVYTGLIPNRTKDKFGIGVTRVENGSKYQEKQKLIGTPVKTTETTMEANYRIECIPGIVIQPDLQYVFNPNTDLTLSNALVGAIRAELSF